MCLLFIYLLIYLFIYIYIFIYLFISFKLLPKKTGDYISSGRRDFIVKHGTSLYLYGIALFNYGTSNFLDVVLTRTDLGLVEFVVTCLLRLLVNEYNPVKAV